MSGGNMHQNIHDSSLLELFQMEAQAQKSVLETGLMLLERSPADPVQLEACMRAAHSLKGAARIVGIDALVGLAHAMEELLVAAQTSTLQLDSARINILLRATDALMTLSKGGSIVGLDTLLTALQQSLQAGAIDTAAVPEASAIASIAAVPPAPTSAPPEPAAVPQAEPSTAAADQRERVVRVGAERLDLLLDLAGRATVANQRALPLQADAQRLRRLLNQTRLALRRLHESTLSRALPPREQAMLGAVSTWLAEAEALQQRHAEAFDDYAWDHAQRSKQLYEQVLAARMRPCADLLAGKARMVRDLGNTLGKPARLEVSGAQTLADRDMLERLDAPLIHLLRNAVDHGVEAPALRQERGKPAEACLHLRMRHAAGRLIVELEDDGNGVDLDRIRSAVVARRLSSAEAVARMDENELLAFLFLPGFSLRAEVSEISGRGVGLDAVQHEVRALRGSLRLRQRAGLGCVFTLELPLTLAVLRSLVFSVGGEAYALPLAQVEHMQRLPAAAVQMIEGRQHIWHNGQPVGLIALSQLLQVPAGAVDALGIPVLLLRSGASSDNLSHALAADQIVGEKNLVVMPLDPRLGPIRDVAAGALLDDGTPVLILDAEAVLASIARLLGGGQVERVAQASASAQQQRRRVLVVDDSLTVRELERKLLAAQGYEVTVAVDGLDGWNQLHAESFDLLVTDIDMPRMDGIELVTQMRRDSRLQAVPVIVVSYKDREEDRRRGLEAGADHYLTKASFHDDSLLDAVRMLIGEAVA